MFASELLKRSVPTALRFPARPAGTQENLICVRRDQVDPAVDLCRVLAVYGCSQHQRRRTLITWTVHIATEVGKEKSHEFLHVCLIECKGSVKEEAELSLLFSFREA